MIGGRKEVERGGEEKMRLGQEKRCVVLSLDRCFLKFVALGFEIMVSNHL